MNTHEDALVDRSRSKVENLAEGRVPRSGIVTPLVRALEVLSAFAAHDSWLGNKEIASRTGLPVSTVSRLLKSLVSLGYMHHCEVRRQYRLSAAVLALGYAATSHSDVQRLVRKEMVGFAGEHNVTVLLAMRDRLDLVVLDSCMGNESYRRNSLYVGTRIGIAHSPLGHTLLAALPVLERSYLMENIARRNPENWPELEPQLTDALRQIRATGFCYSLSRVESGLGVLSVPLSFTARGLFVLACLGPLGHMSKARVMRELGPKLVSMANQLKRSLE